jgi:hypothetical protein
LKVRLVARWPGNLGTPVTSDLEILTGLQPMKMRKKPKQSLGHDKPVVCICKGGDSWINKSPCD